MSERLRSTARTAALVCASVGTVAAVGCGTSNPVGIPPGATVVASAEVDTLVDESSSGVTEPRRDGTLHVVVLESSPGPSCGTTQAFTQPVQAVAVHATDG